MSSAETCASGSSSSSPSASSPALKLLAALATLVAGAGAAVLVLNLLHHTPGPISAAGQTTSATATPTQPAAVTPAVPHGFPAPPAGAVVFSREDGADTLALGLLQRQGGLLAQVSVLNDQGNGLPGLAVALKVRGTRKPAVPCGTGCYRASFSGSANPRVVLVQVTGKGATTSWAVTMPATWPVPAAAPLVAKAAKTWRQLKTLSYIDRLASAPGFEVTSRWQIVAPDRISYTLPNGSGAVIIGDSRWDREGAGKRWIHAPQLPVVQPVAFWASATNAHLLGTATFDGHRVQDVSFFDPVSLAWFEVAIDEETSHTLDLHMTAAAHFMHDTYTSFDAPMAINPPTG